MIQEVKTAFQRAERAIQKGIIELLDEQKAEVLGLFSEIALDEKKFRDQARDSAIDYASELQKKLREFEHLRETNPRAYIDCVGTVLNHYEENILVGMLVTERDFQEQQRNPRQRAAPKEIYLNSKKKNPW